MINAITSLIIVDGNKVIRFKGDTRKHSYKFIFFLSIITFYIASKGLSILYLFLLADLFCCSAVLSVFYGFYSKSLKEKNIYFSIIAGFIVGILLFPSPDFSKSLLVGIIMPIDYFPTFVTQSLLFLSFLSATFVPIVTWKMR